MQLYQLLGAGAGAGAAPVKHRLKTILNLNEETIRDRIMNEELNLLEELSITSLKADAMLILDHQCCMGGLGHCRCRSLKDFKSIGGNASLDEIEHINLLYVAA